ncbi:MAG TPA: hypothetical protein VK919_09890 [Solirubrobacterales bacterium]|nr:hypothetical protein [Solirubrobacterales bacterium]
MTSTRRTASIVLAVAGALCLVLGGLLLYARVALFESDAFADRAAEALADERVEHAVTAPIVNAIVDSGPAELINAQPILEAGVAGVIDSAAFRSTFRDAVRRAHSALFDGGVETVVLTLADAGVIAIEAIRSISPEVARDIPEDLEPELIEIADGTTLEVADLAHDIRLFGVVLPLLGFVLLAGSVLAAPARRPGLVRAAAAVAVGAGITIAAVLIGRSVVLAQFDDEAVHDAVTAAWDVLFGDLLIWFGALGVGAVILAAAAYAGVREVDPAAPLRRAGAIASWRPARPAVRLARAVGILALSLLLVIRPEVVLHVAVVAIGGWGLFVAVTEILLVVAPPPEPVTAGAPRRMAGLLGRIRPGRALAVLGTAAAVVALAVVVLAGGGGEEVVERPDGPVSACNGFEALCERRIDQVALAATHNSMSAAREPGWYLPNQRYGIARQLDDGVRALLIDTHYGIETDGGTVVTDIGRETASREEIEAQIGADGIERVERIRARLIGDADPADARPHLCHVFCELGATELTEALTEVREFLDTHPDEFVVLFVEDVVVPEDVEQAFEDSGLLRYAYEHRRGEPFPTLRELIESDRRAFVLGETHSGGAALPWYHQGFALVQETPYTFHDATEIASPESCQPNRGTTHNPLFQINNWIEKIPRSPDLAERVNDYDVLTGRARLCQRRRGLLPNIIAVDHYDRGDVFGVVNALNELGRAARPDYRETG